MGPASAPAAPCAVGRVEVPLTVASGFVVSEMELVVSTTRTAQEMIHKLQGLRHRPRNAQFCGGVPRGRNGGHGISSLRRLPDRVGLKDTLP